VATINEVRCTLCAEPSRLDEHDRCEQCVLDAEHIACRLYEAESAIAAVRRCGLSEEQIHDAMQMMCSATDGALNGTPVPSKPGTG